MTLNLKLSYFQSPTSLGLPVGKSVSSALLLRKLSIDGCGCVDMIVYALCVNSNTNSLV